MGLDLLESFGWLWFCCFGLVRNEVSELAESLWRPVPAITGYSCTPADFELGCLFTHQSLVFLKPPQAEVAKDRTEAECEKGGRPPGETFIGGEMQNVNAQEAEYQTGNA